MDGDNGQIPYNLMLRIRRDNKEEEEEGFTNTNKKTCLLTFEINLTVVTSIPLEAFADNLYIVSCITCTMIATLFTAYLFSWNKIYTLKTKALCNLLVTATFQYNSNDTLWNFNLMIIIIINYVKETESFLSEYYENYF